MCNLFVEFHRCYSASSSYVQHSCILPLLLFKDLSSPVCSFVICRWPSTSLSLLASYTYSPSHTFHRYILNSIERGERTTKLNYLTFEFSGQFISYPSINVVSPFSKLLMNRRSQSSDLSLLIDPDCRKGWSYFIFLGGEETEVMCKRRGKWEAK